MYTLTLTYLGAPTTRLAALAKLSLRGSDAVEIRISAVGSKWDDAGDQPLTSCRLGDAEQPHLELTSASSATLAGDLEWPACLPLGDLLQLRLRSRELEETRVWARVEGIRPCRAAPTVSAAAVRAA